MFGTFFISSIPLIKMCVLIEYNFAQLKNELNVVIHEIVLAKEPGRVHLHHNRKESVKSSLQSKKYWSFIYYLSSITASLRHKEGVNKNLLKK